MFRKNHYLATASFLTLFITSCDFDNSREQVADTDNSSLNNTLGDQLTGTQGPLSEYFYNFENDVNVTYFRFNPNLMSNYKSYSDYYNIFGSDPTTMTFKTFPDHLVSMDASNESEYTKRNYIDSLSVIDSVVYDSIQMTSTPFKNLESLEWNLLAQPSLQRYKLLNSSWIVSDTMLFYNDTFDISAYWSVVDTPFIDSGLLFVDSSEWNDTNYVFISDEPFRFVNTFEFTKKQMSADSLVFRINTDCNDNGVWDQSENTIIDYNNDGIFEALYEFSDNNNNGIFDAGDDIIEDYNSDGIISIAFEFEDRGNGLWDPQEPFFDIDSSGTYSINEPYQDRNCNNRWDGAEDYEDADNSQSYTLGETFVDRGNGLFDNEEEYNLRLNADGTSDTLLFKIGEKPDNLVVDWADPTNPRVLLNINLGDDITTRWGDVYNNIIEEITFFDSKQQYVNDVDSLVTLFTREKVGHIDSPEASLSPDDYYITKSEWSRDVGNQTERYYNYHIFHEPEHLNQVKYPSYFMPSGFYFTPAAIENGFWHKKNLESEVLYYTSNGYLRDGEMVDTAYYDTTNIAVYYIQKSYRVESESVVVPAGHRASLSQAAVDTVFSDCFKVTQIITMAMVGSGLEYGQRTVSWLVKNKGLVKSEVHVRWTEHPYDSDYTRYDDMLDENNEAWVGLNRIELSSIDIQPESGLFKKLANPVKEIKLRDIANHPEFDQHPFYVSNQQGLHTIDLRDLEQ